MTGHDYLLSIKEQLTRGRHQHKMGVNILDAFGYARRRKTAIDVINEELRSLGLETSPPIDIDMPLTVPRIRFSLVSTPYSEESVSVPNEPALSVSGKDEDVEEETEETAVESSFVPSFRVAELAAAEREVECISASETIQKAYTVMSLKKYSQLVVADGPRPLTTAIKGIISYQSIANASLHGAPTSVRDCLDIMTPQVKSEDDISLVIAHLVDHDVVLVIGRDKRLSGIITAWDLTDEFEKLVGPFLRIGESEVLLRKCLMARLGKETIRSFLTSNRGQIADPNPDLLTLGDIQWIVQNPDLWGKLNLPYDRQAFAAALHDVREMRNRLMHFRDPLNADETKHLRNFCQMVRKIP